MPIYLEDLDFVSEVAGLPSALIVPCNMCPAVNVSVRSGRPFMQLFGNFLRSPPFEQYIKSLQSRLNEKGVSTGVFKSAIPNQWFLCMWTAGRRRKLSHQAKQYQALVVLGCASATATVRDAVSPTGPKVIEGMKAAGFMNAKMNFHLPGNITFEDCKVTPISR
jgi:hypothetical protein